jgi:UPF0042 nucleotide-binding protein
MSDALRPDAENTGLRPAAQAARPMVVVVTGLSGAGKSQALHALEDLSFFCVDNLPTLLAPQAVALCERGGMTRVALGIDVRVRAFLDEAGSVLQLLEAGGQRDLQVLFLDANDETLLRRFSESRRPHPLSAQSGHEGALAVLDGVRLERERLAPLRASATRVIDTTNTSVHDLRRLMVAHFGPASGGAPRMVTRIVSFGFKYGTPVDADVVLDVRFLDNPYFVPELRALTGLDEAVAKYVLGAPETQEFMRRARELLEYVMPKYEREGKSYLTIAIGCTGGKHRSVAIAEALARDLAQAAPSPGGSVRAPLTVVHRDADRSAPPSLPDSDALHSPSLVRPPSSLELKGLTSSSPPPQVAAKPSAPVAHTQPSQPAVPSHATRPSRTGRS